MKMYIDDVARTLKEGRFWSQINKMVAWKNDFQSRNIDCYLHYILEREPEDYVVQCEDGCQGVGRCGNPTLTQVKLAIEDLKRHPDLLVKMTDSIEVTVILLSSLTAELIERANRGDFDDMIVQEISKENGERKVNFDDQNKNCKEDDLLEIDLLNESDNVPVLLTEDDEIRSIERSVDYNKNEKLQHKRIRKGNDIVSDTAADSYDDELAIAIEKSKQDIRCNNNNSFATVSNMCNKTKHNMNSRLLGKDDTDNTLDTDLALAIERSKRDTGCDIFRDTGCSRSGERQNGPSVPLMQYHCSLSKSVTCTIPSPKKNDNNTNVYRPKINRTKVYNTQSLQPEFTITTADNHTGGTKKCSNSCLERQSKVSTSKLLDLSKQTDDMLNSESNFDRDSCSRTDRNSRLFPYLGLTYNTSHSIIADTSKRTLVDEDKQIYKGEKHFLSSVDRNASNNIKKKKQMTFKFSPKKELIEKNIVNIHDSKPDVGISGVSSNSNFKTNLFPSSCYPSLKENTYSDSNSGQHIFDNDQSSTCPHNVNRTTLLQEQDFNSSRFEQDSDKSSSDSLPDLQSCPSDLRPVCSRQKMVSRHSDLDKNNGENLYLKQRHGDSFPNISINSAIHSPYSKKDTKSIVLSDSDDEMDSSHENEQRFNGFKYKCNVKQKTASSNYHIVNDDIIEEKIDTVLAVLPQLDREKCFWLLHRFLGKVERCIEHVIQEESKLKPGEVVDLDC